MDRDYCVYIHTNKSNNKRYIGLTHQKPNERWHNGTNYYHNQYFTRAIKKYGWENFEHEIVASGLTGDEASALEIELIAKYRSNETEFGYNLDAGGTRTKHSEETKKKISIAITGIKRSAETIEKIRRNTPINRGFLGHTHTEEANKKNREAHLGKTHICSDDAKYNIMFGHKNRKEIVCVESGAIYPSIGYAAKLNNISQGTISLVLSGKRKTAGGYHWIYKQQQKV